MKEENGGEVRSRGSANRTTSSTNGNIMRSGLIEFGNGSSFDSMQPTLVSRHDNLGGAPKTTEGHIYTSGKGHKTMRNGQSYYTALRNIQNESRGEHLIDVEPVNIFDKLHIFHAFTPIL